MNFDIKGKIEEIAGKIKNDPKLLKNFESEPVKTVESVVGVDLPDDKIQPLVEGVKAKLNLDETVKGARGVLDSVMGLFGKKK